MEPIIDAAVEENKHEHHLPTFFMGDFNGATNTYGIIKELIDEDQWVDFGAKASWWGGIDNQCTCQGRM